MFFTGKRIIGSDGNETTNDMYHENTMLAKENSNLRTRIKAMQETIEHLTAKNSQLLADKELGMFSNNMRVQNNHICHTILKINYSNSRGLQSKVPTWI